MSFCSRLRKCGIVALHLSVFAVAQPTSRRTVSSSEIGSIFAQPNGFSYTDLGAALATSKSGVLDLMKPEAVKIIAARFHVFEAGDGKAWPYFPYAAFRHYEAAEIAAHQPPLFVTATYKGKKRRVLWRWSLALKDNRPTTPPVTWKYAINVRDRRFMQFWVDSYIRAILLKDVRPAPNLWIGLDECAFNWQLYGVLDDDGQYVSGIPWDPPFPRNEDEYLASLQYFFREIRSLAPDVRVACNLGSMRDERRFPDVFADVPGIMLENLLDLDSSPSGRYKTYLSFRNYSWFGSQNRVGLYRALVSATKVEQMTSAVLVYLLLRGANSFFAPQFDDNTLAVPPSRYARLLKRMGAPVGTLQSRVPPGSSDGYRLYWRPCENGIVYMNWTGTDQEITLPIDKPYFDREGRPVSHIRIPDLDITYVFAGL